MCEKNIIPDYIACRALAVLDFWQVSWIFSDFLVRCPDFSVGGVGRYVVVILFGTMSVLF